MSNTFYFTEALYQLYPTVVTTIGNVAYDVNGNVVSYDPVAVQAEADKLDCKAQATSILQTTDWTSIADVGNPDMANPYLMNQDEFVAYRSTVRNYAVNPVENPVFPTAPTEQWSS
jgi:hypothetical protein